jgi:hypothetical protein
MIRRQIMPVTGREGSIFKSGTCDGFAIRGHVGYPVDPDVGLVEKAGQEPEFLQAAQAGRGQGVSAGFFPGELLFVRTRTRKPRLAA